jgi:two-component system sensor histidine kinase YesM
MIINYAAANNRRRLEHVKTSNKNAAVSLDAVGENIHSMAVYISYSESFRNYYYPGVGKSNLFVMENLAFHSMIFVTSHYSIVRNIALVNLDGSPVNHYLWSGGKYFEFIDLLKPRYDFSNPYNLENSFFFFEGKNYFVYIVPVVKMDSAINDRQKTASCVLICDINIIQETIKNYELEGGFRFSVYDDNDRLIITNGPEGDFKTSRAVKTPIQFSSKAEFIGLNVVTTGTYRFLGRSDVNTRFIWLFIGLSMVLLLLITGTVIFLLKARIALPISRLESEIMTRDNTRLHRRLVHQNIMEIDHIVDEVNKLLDEIDESTRTVMEDQQKLYELEIRKKEVEIYALQSQINPHFFNNTLQCIRSIALSRGVDEIAKITLAMSKLLNYSMNYEEIVPVKEEIELVQYYIDITNIRFLNRFTFSFNLDPRVYQARMCRMLLQPLVENAVRHGAAMREDGGSVEICGKAENGIVILEVIDDGPGFGEAKLREIRGRLSRDFEENRESYNGKSFGLYNINRRLKLNYGEAYGLEIKHTDGKTHVSLNFPSGVEPPFSN